MDRKRRLLDAWKALAAELQESHGYSREALAAELHTNGDAIPLSAFGHGMTPLEAAARYLKHTGHDEKEIAQTLGRSKTAIERMLVHSHLAAKTIAYTPSDKLIPATLFANGTPATEALCTHLRERYELTNKQIANALQLDQRTIWTVFNRAEKRGGTQ